MSREKDYAVTKSVLVLKIGYVTVSWYGSWTALSHSVPVPERTRVHNMRCSEDANEHSTCARDSRYGLWSGSIELTYLINVVSSQAGFENC